MDNFAPPAQEGDEEVTFLLRFKPAPTPPVRRRKNILSISNGWDVAIERQEISKTNLDCPPPVPPRFTPSAPPPEPDNFWSRGVDIPNYYNVHANGNFVNYNVGIKSIQSPPTYSMSRPLSSTGYNQPIIGSQNHRVTVPDITSVETMREVCKSGAVVAAVVAVLEKQSRQYPKPPPPAVPPRMNPTWELTSSNSTSRNSCDISRKPSQSNNTITNTKHHNSFEKDGKNRNGADEDQQESESRNFELAVQDFNSVVQDVEKTFSEQEVAVKSQCFTNSKLQQSSKLLRSNEAPRGVDGGTDVRRKNCLTIDVKSEEDRELEGESNRTENRSSFQKSPSCSEEILVVLGLEADEEIDSDSLERSSSDSEGELYLHEGLATITEEERVSGSSARSSRVCEEDDSSIEDDTLKDQNQVWSGSASNQDGSTSDISSSASENVVGAESGSTRCTSDFKWIRKESSPKNQSSPVTMEEEPTPLTKPPIARPVRDKTPRKSSNERQLAPGSLDRRRPNPQKREERDQKARSSHVKSPPRLDDFQQPPNGYSNGFCCPPPYDGYFESFHRRHERSDPQRYGSSPMLMDHRFDRGSHPDIYGDCSRYRHEMACCAYHLGPPPCCYFGGGERGGYHWTPPSYPKPGEQDEKLRKIQYEKDNLQLQVQVLTEQIEAQSDKISDLEKVLQEKKSSLSESEDKLQREVLSRSSLETQKLELMSIISEMKLTAAALERENMELRNSHLNNNTDGKKPPVMPRGLSQPLLTSTPQYPNQGLRSSPSPSPIGSSSFQTDSLRPKTPPANYKRQIDIQYGSLPRQQFLSAVDSNGGPPGMDTNANPQKKGVAFGRNGSLQHLSHSGMMYGGGGSRLRGLSVPNLAESEKDSLSSKDGSPSSPTLTFNNKNKGIRKIFGKMRRSGSGNLEDLPAGVGEFQRGGVRATAAARLGWSEPQLNPKPDKPFAEWDTENICDWLQDLSLDQYVPEAKRWVKNGQHLLESTINEIEKELSIKNPLHRKKLQLALIDTSENSSSDLLLSLAGKLDTAWVLRWLDDAGLPQYKENFLINRVDGRVLHRLTMDDLSLLHVTSLLHVASIKRGIQVLRENGYEPSCLQRRSLPDDPEKPNPQQISLWTTHRVMEWLRAVDLAEYAPNLRGAGVHGGLMVMEPKFNADLLASLLSIPPGKTLLRRHLNTHFKELLGKDIIQEKRDLESTMGYTPLTPSSKLKVAKKSQFSLKRKKSKGEADYGDLVCPFNPDQSGEQISSVINMGMEKTENHEEEDVCLRADKKSITSRSLPTSVRNSPVTLRHV